ncbi:MAG: response regulator [Pseudomonadota bacterium]|nr:response regulator [Pseudomonadota bacterium]MDE3037285.1 response regulator [Pseudomonadota bacterium]
MMSTGLKKAPDHLKNIHVMIVDNDQKIIAIIVRVLQCFGFRNIFEARDGFSAVETLRQHDIDLIITDWELLPLKQHDIYDLPSNPVVRSDQWSPVMPKDGACFVKYIRLSKYSPNPFVPVIMVTGLGLRGHIEYARDAGVNEIILKPLTIENLCERISMVIDRPRCFVTSASYKGPCRRRERAALKGQAERRKHDVKLFKHTA